MNRKDRRAAQKHGKGGPPRGPFGPSMAGLSGGPTTSLFAMAVQNLNAGNIVAAERACRDVLAFDPNHADALHLLGMIAFQIGRHDDALALIGQSIAVNGKSAESHFNMAQVLRTLGRLDEAAGHFTQAAKLRRDYAPAHAALGDLALLQDRPADARDHYRRALALEAGSADAHYGIATAAMQQGRLDEAADHYRQALVLRPDHAEACNNLGIVLSSQGQFPAAAELYQRALTLRPDLIEVYTNLGRLVLTHGDATQALAVARRALEVKETDETKAFFAQCIRHLPADAADDHLSALVTRALSEAWSRPSELSTPAVSLFRNSATGRRFIGRAWDAESLPAVAGDRLLRALLEAGPICDIDLERLFTGARSALLAAALNGEPAKAVTHNELAFFCALARQCFINEYVFALDAAETMKVSDLRTMLAAALESGAAVPVLWPVALASTMALHTVPHAEALLQRTWPAPVNALLDQQIREPLAQRLLSASIPAATAITDEVSRKVRGQYEDMPYPRWIKPAPPTRPTTIDWYLRNQFPAAPFRDLGTRRPDILIAGCGTGQHAIETAQRYMGANVLAIDLSRASLSYAKHKTGGLGVSNIAYAQADILELGSLTHRFDLIETSGVLHHLHDPAAGWRVLLSLLRPGGVMQVGLYSAAARDDVRAARGFIADGGYGTSADDIRRCRQDILALDEGSPVRNVTRYNDFFTTSECRDLVFHVQEHQLTIPQIKTFLADNRLTFIGFAGEPMRAYRQRFPDDRTMTDLDRWHTLESEHPKLFVGMYQFWIQKPAA